MPAVTSVWHGGRPSSACWLRGKRVVEETVGHGIEGLEMNFYPLELFASLVNISVNLTIKGLDRVV